MKRGRPVGLPLIFSLFHSEGRPHHRWGGPGWRGAGNVAGDYMYYITIIYITYIRMENID